MNNSNVIQVDFSAKRLRTTTAAPAMVSQTKVPDSVFCRYEAYIETPESKKKQAVSDFLTLLAINGVVFSVIAYAYSSGAPVGGIMLLGFIPVAASVISLGLYTEKLIKRLRK